MSRTPSAVRVLSLAVVLILAATPFAGAAPKESKEAVKITATADKPDADGKQTVTITLEIDKDWHLYANPVKNAMMTDSQTVVKILANNKELADTQIKYPAGKEKKDADFGNYNIYEGKVEVTATVRRAKDDTTPLEISLQISACDDKKCLLPSTVKMKAEQK